MNFWIIIVGIFSINAQAMTVREHKHIQKMLKSAEQNMEHASKTSKNVEKQTSTFKEAFETFTRCQKLRAKLMIKYRNRPRLLRRIKNLTLDC